MIMVHLRYVVLALLLAVVPLGATGCQTSPATGQSQFNILSESEELAIGSEAAPEFLDEFGGPIPSESVQQYVADVGQRMAALSERPDLPWEFHTVDSATVNAFALPGGKVFISRGLLAHMTNEAQLASVLGHEIGHVTDKHIGQRMTQAMLAQVGLGLLGTQTESDWVVLLGGAATGTYMLSFGRHQEHQADRLGLRYMTAAGYNPAGALQVMEILSREGGGGGLEFFSTHPYPESRIDRIHQIIESEYPDYDDPGRYSFYEDRFQQQLSSTLAELPPPSHRPGQ